MEITTIGLDQAKGVFRSAINGGGEVVVRKALRRAPRCCDFERLAPCLVGIEACGTSHHWAREIRRLGHEVRLMPPAYVKPYVKRGKSDASDAEAICEAVSRPTMRYVAIKSCEQQAALTVHRTAGPLGQAAPRLVNMIRGLLAEFGIEIRRGVTHALSLAERIAAGEMPDIPALAAKMIASLAGQVLDLQTRLREIERELLAWHRSSDIARRLATIPGVGTICATAFAASVTDPHQFRSGRQFAAWLGLTPLQHSSGGKERLGRISKMGDKYLRRLLVVGMTSLVRRAKYKPEAVDPWLADLLSRKPVRVVTVALANKTARVIWAIMTRGGTYRAPQPAGAVVA